MSWARLVKTVLLNVILVEVLPSKSHTGVTNALPAPASSIEYMYVEELLNYFIRYVSHSVEVARSLYDEPTKSKLFLNENGSIGLP